jgi:putative NADH-flavin reductase
MKILVICGTGHVRRLVVDELRARGVDVQVLARQRPRLGTLPGKVEVAIGDLIRSEISPEVVDLNVRFLMRVAKAFKVPIVLSSVGVEIGKNHPTGVDAVGGTSQLAHQTGIQRSVAAGAAPSTSRAVVDELFCDWRTPQDEVYGKEILPWYLPQTQEALRSQSECRVGESDDPAWTKS